MNFDSKNKTACLTLTSMYCAVLSVCAVLFLGACSDSIKAEEERLAKERAQKEAVAKTEKGKPIHRVTDIGTFDGCEVKFYQRMFAGYNTITDRFYIAKCEGAKNTNTTTAIHTEPSFVGKYVQYVDKLETTITQEVEEKNTTQQMLMLENKKRILELSKEIKDLEASMQKVADMNTVAKDVKKK